VLRMNGFSLLEVIVAVSILTIGILAVMQMKVVSQRNISSGNIVTAALMLAHSEIERVKGTAEIIGLQDRFASDPNVHDPYLVEYSFADPLSETMQMPVYANCGTGLFDGSGSCLATVTVSWNRGGGGRGGDGEVQLRTMVYEGRS